MNTPIIEMCNIAKYFGNVKALDNVNLSIYSGEVHALLGENGAGKSTLMKVLSGIHHPTHGSIEINGRDYTCLTHQEAAELGISIIYQELSLIEELSVLENIFIGRLLTKKVLGIEIVDWSLMRHEAELIMGELGMDINLDAKVEDLAISYKQMIEIAKALSTNARVLIMDEPTSSLTKTEVDKLFSVVKKLRNKGTAIVYISHKLKEIHQICDRYTVIRDGHSMGSGLVEGTSDDEIIRLMVGREIEKRTREASKIQNKPVVLSVENITSWDKKTVKGVSFDVRQGEIIGFAGLVGAGRTEIMNCLFGIDAINSGKIIYKNKDITPRSPLDAMNNGMAYVTESRRENGFFDNFTIGQNIAIAHSLKRGGYCGMMGCFNPHEESSMAQKYKSLLSIKCDSIHQKITDLSGGNQQKVIISKWMASDPEIIIFDEPTRGIDVGAKSEIYKIMRQLCDDGKVVIMVSSELPEILSVSDRVAVVNEGHISNILLNQNLSEEEIMKWALPN
ncbi:D-allose ABC transporter ATP-binding protein AlsA [Vibrio sp. SA48]|uniref:D-allose ABC transporter ATP-binding protein AlsA n=1 Tax=Vibrio sp. S12_S33 TaxID=2720223 RepID=UPI001781403A|nr:D-allose ABC transporter ATP-binding protein AlsA [Vibrio sp. S12_S33]MBD1566451.1 D-allose ABC transporter ATP-binding protein AlsA [Vibrio sp. S12_S33]